MIDRNNISVSLKKRFCKDFALPIKMYEDDIIFQSRLDLFENMFQSRTKWEMFIDNLVNNYENEQDYLEQDNKLLDALIDSIKNNEAYLRFNAEDFNKFSLGKDFNYPDRDIYKDDLVNQRFISIDLKKANFQALRHYDLSIFNGASTWEEYIKKFTKDPIKPLSKHFRQVMFGALNPKRTTTYEKFLMGGLLKQLINYFNLSKEQIISFNCDEIVLSATGDVSIEGILHVLKWSDLDCHVQEFTLKKIAKDVYCKEFTWSDNEKEIGTREYKKVNHLIYPFVARMENKEVPEVNDYYFMHEGIWAKLCENPLLNNLSYKGRA